MKPKNAIVFLLTCCSFGCAQHFEGETCTVPTTKQNGRCIKIHGCQYAKDLLKRNQNPGVCGFEGTVPLVCCPQSEELRREGSACRLFATKESGRCVKPHHCEYRDPIPKLCKGAGNRLWVCCRGAPRRPLQAVGTLAAQKCNEYHDDRVLFLDKGKEALPKEFPHMAAVGYGTNKAAITWLCGGTLISHYFVLSAAHCAHSLNFGPAMWIRLGDLDLQNTTEDANPMDIKIAQTFVHPEYKLSSHYHDIALFKLEWIIFGLYFKPACLHLQKDLSSTTLEVTGWGNQGLYGDTSSHLLKASLNLVNYTTCKKRYANVANNSRKLNVGILDEFQMCAGDKEGRDTCPGDSGGPLHYRVGKLEYVLSHFVVAGVTSFGKGCGGEDTIGVYTRVSAYVGWIEGIVWKEGVE